MGTSKITFGWRRRRSRQPTNSERNNKFVGSVGKFLIILIQTVMRLAVNPLTQIGFFLGAVDHLQLLAKERLPSVIRRIGFAKRNEILPSILLDFGSSSFTPLHFNVPPIQHSHLSR